MLEARLAQRGWQPALLKGDADSFSEQMNSAPLLLSLTMQECHGSRKGFIQGNEKEKRIPTPFRLLASIPHLTTRENRVVKGTSDFAPHLSSLQAQEGEERMAACRRLGASHVPQIFGSSKNEFYEEYGSFPIAAELQWGPCLPPPVFSIFSSVRSR